MEDQQPNEPYNIGDLVAEAGAAIAEAKAKLAPRLAALRAVQPGDIIVSGNAESVYTGVVTEACEGGNLISLAFQVYTFEGVFRSVEANAFTHVEIVAARPVVRILRATEGVL